MRQITAKIVHAFEGRNALKIGNSRTDGNTLWLFDNRIAFWMGDSELWVSNGGWDSATTKERLNGLTGVHVKQKNGVWLLNGRIWDGSWVNVSAWDSCGIYIYEDVQQSVQVSDEPEFDITSEWMDDGYSQPIYSIFHTLSADNIGAVEVMLNNEQIPTKVIESDTEGVYRPNYFVVVRPQDISKSVDILSASYCLA
jgi:hypothetical protein